MASLLKVVLALRHEEIPAQPAFGALNPTIAWDALPGAARAYVERLEEAYPRTPTRESSEPPG